MKISAYFLPKPVKFVHFLGNFLYTVQSWLFNTSKKQINLVHTWKSFLVLSHKLVHFSNYKRSKVILFIKMFIYRHQKLVTCTSRELSPRCTIFDCSYKFSTGMQLKIFNPNLLILVRRKTQWSNYAARICILV